MSRPGQVGYDPRLRHGRGLVADTLDGRFVERTITTDRPDTDLRRQVKAADVSPRAPFTRLSGRSLEIDHVIPYGTDLGGVTGELNLAALDDAHTLLDIIDDEQPEGARPGRQERDPTLREGTTGNRPEC